MIRGSFGTAYPFRLPDKKKKRHWNDCALGKAVKIGITDFAKENFNLKDRGRADLKSLKTRFFTGEKELVVSS